VREVRCVEAPLEKGDASPFDDGRSEAVTRTGDKSGEPQVAVDCCSFLGHLRGCLSQMHGYCRFHDTLSLIDTIVATMASVRNSAASSVVGRVFNATETLPGGRERQPHEPGCPAAHASIE
jgi:hypothetical protein